VSSITKSKVKGKIPLQWEAYAVDEFPSPRLDEEDEDDEDYNIVKEEADEAMEDAAPP
jgi:hypothetical protein